MYFQFFWLIHFKFKSVVTTPPFTFSNVIVEWDWTCRKDFSESLSHWSEMLCYTALLWLNASDPSYRVSVLWSVCVNCCTSNQAFQVTEHAVISALCGGYCWQQCTWCMQMFVHTHAKETWCFWSKRKWIKPKQKKNVFKIFFMLLHVFFFPWFPEVLVSNPTTFFVYVLTAFQLFSHVLASFLHPHSVSRKTNKQLTNLNGTCCSSPNESAKA